MTARLSPEEALQGAFSKLETYVRQEGSEGTNPADQVEMAAFDLGYQGEKLPDWVVLLGKHFRLNLRKEWEKGHKARTASSTASRVVTRYLQADGASGARSEAVRHTHPINKPKGIERSIVKEHARGAEHAFEEAVRPNRRDIRPEDVFAGTPNQMNVRNLAETGKDQQKALDKQIPKDKGYNTVYNLSQYLIRTEGGGNTPPAGKKL